MKTHGNEAASGYADIPRFQYPGALKQNSKIFWLLLRKTYTEWNGDRATLHGAALAYYTVFSLSPLIIIVVGIAGLLFGREAAQGEIQRQLTGIVGATTAAAIQGLVANAGRTSSGLLATIIGLVTLIFGASGVFGQLQEALNRVWKIPTDIHQGWTGMIVHRFSSFLMVLSIGVLLLVSLVVSTALSALEKYFSERFAESLFALEIANGLISFGMITLLFALMYRVLPERHIVWSDVWLGALFTALFFNLGKYLIGLYLSHSSVASTFGAAASVVLLLVWVYYSAQVFLFGAEFTYVFTNYRKRWWPKAEDHL